MPNGWNPTAEPARSVKQILVRLGARDVIPARTMGDLGLGSNEVQVAMNTKFFSDSDARLTEEQCGVDVTVATLILEIVDLQGD
jgi:hypothetical protein